MLQLEMSLGVVPINIGQKWGGAEAIEQEMQRKHFGTRALLAGSTRATRAPWHPCDDGAVR